MFTYTCNKRDKQPLNDWFIIVNGQKCMCNKAVAEEISPIIQSFNKEKKSDDLFLITEIPGNQPFSDSSVNSTNSFKSMYALISKIFCGEEIIFQEDNIEILNLIGKHFQIQEIIKKIEEYQKYSEMISIYIKNCIDLKEMEELEHILHYEINSTNIEIKVKEYESLIKKIPINCFIHFVINICRINNNIKKANMDEFVIEIIKNVDKIIPETLTYFISIMSHKFVLMNSIFTNEKDKYNKKEINSLFHQMFVDGLMKSSKKIVDLRKLNYIEIPKDFKNYFNNDFYELSNENKAKKENRETNDQYDSLIELIMNDNIDSFQKCIISLQIDINKVTINDITNRISIKSDDNKYSLIELSAFFGSIKCFTYLYNKQANFIKNRLSNFAVAGGNPDIIHICEREDCIFNERTLDISIEYHRYQLTKWLVETKYISVSERDLRNSIMNYNIKIMKYLIKKGINLNKMIIYISESNNIILFKWLEEFLKNYELKLIYQENKKTALHIACEQNNVEIVKLLIPKDIIDINSVYEVNIR